MHRCVFDAPASVSVELPNGKYITRPWEKKELAKYRLEVLGWPIQRAIATNEPQEITPPRAKAKDVMKDVEKALSKMTPAERKLMLAKL